MTLAYLSAYGINTENTEHIVRDKLFQRFCKILWRIFFSKGTSWCASLSKLNAFVNVSLQIFQHPQIKVFYDTSNLLMLNIDGTWNICNSRDRQRSSTLFLVDIWLKMKVVSMYIYQVFVNVKMKLYFLR